MSITPDLDRLDIATRIKRAGLPKSYDVHWSQSRKETVVRAVRDRLISFDEARWRYLLSRSEFDSWAQSVDRNSENRKQTELESA